VVIDRGADSPSDRPSGPVRRTTGSRADALELAVTHFNARRYWHAYGVFRALWRDAQDDEREFFEGLTLVSEGLLHLQRRSVRMGRAALQAGLARLARYGPAHAGLVIAEILDISERLLAQMDAGRTPYPIPPVIKYVDAPSDGPIP
jgi:hypothetical protein